MWQVSQDEVFNGLAFAAGAFALLGKAGVWLTLLICFMAITSSGAGELVATSSLFTFDFYRRYINPEVGISNKLSDVSFKSRSAPARVLASS